MPVNQLKQSQLTNNSIHPHQTAIFTKARNVEDFLSGLEAINKQEIDHEVDHLEFLERTLKSLKNNVKVLRNLRNENIRSDSRSMSRRGGMSNNLQGYGNARFGSQTMSPALTDFESSKHDIYSRMNLNSKKPQKHAQKSRTARQKKSFGSRSRNPIEESQVINSRVVNPDGKLELRLQGQFNKLVQASRDKNEFFLKNSFSKNPSDNQNQTFGQIESFRNSITPKQQNIKPFGTFRHDRGQNSKSISITSRLDGNLYFDNQASKTDRTKFNKSTYINPNTERAGQDYKYLWDADSNDEEAELKKSRARVIAEEKFNNRMSQISRRKTFVTSKDKFPPMIYKSVVINNTGGNLTGFGTSFTDRIGKRGIQSFSKDLNDNKYYTSRKFTSNIKIKTRVQELAPGLIKSKVNAPVVKQKQDYFKKTRPKLKNLNLETDGLQSSEDISNLMSPVNSYLKFDQATPTSNYQLNRVNIAHLSNASMELGIKENKNDRFKPQTRTRKPSQTENSGVYMQKKFVLPYKSDNKNRSSPKFNIQLPVQQIDDLGSQEGYTSREPTDREDQRFARINKIVTQLNISPKLEEENETEEIESSSVDSDIKKIHEQARQKNFPNFKNNIDLDGDSSNIYMTHQTFNSNGLQTSNEVQNIELVNSKNKTNKSFKEPDKPDLEIQKFERKQIEDSRPSTHRHNTSTNKSSVQQSVSKILNQLKKVKLTGRGGVGLRSGSMSRDLNHELKLSRRDDLDEIEISKHADPLSQLREPLVKDFANLNIQNEPKRYIDFDLNRNYVDDGI